jgi:DNA polymerase delta subunit 3
VFIVTIQEQGWESFSEEETQAPKTKPQAEKTTAAAKPKKAAGKGVAQGNIMSFFSKK